MMGRLWRRVKAILLRRWNLQRQPSRLKSNLAHQKREDQKILRALQKKEKYLMIEKQKKLKMIDKNVQIVENDVDQAVTNHPVAEEATGESRGEADRDILEKAREDMKVENGVIDGVRVLAVAVVAIVQETVQQENREGQVEEEVVKDRKIFLVEAHPVEQLEFIQGLIIMIKTADQKLRLILLVTALHLKIIRKQRRKSRNKHSRFPDILLF